MSSLWLIPLIPVPFLALYWGWLLRDKEGIAALQRLERGY